MKKVKFLPLLLIFVFLFSSCASMSASELKNRLIIEGIGIDYDEEKEEYKLTVQVLVTSHSGGTESAPDNPVENHSVSGKTVGQALSELCNTTGRKPLYSQNRVIVLGKSLSGDRMIKALDYFAREYASRADIYVTAASGDAADIMTVSEGYGEITSKVIEESILESYNSSVSVNTELFNVVNLSLEENTWFTMPLLEVDENRKTDGKVVKVTGTYVYNKDGEENRLSSEETMFFQLIMNEAQTGTFSIECDGAAVGLDIIKSKTKIKTSMKNGMPFYTIKVKSAVDIKEYETEEFGNLKKTDMDAIKKAAAAHLKSGILHLLERELKTEKSDIFRFGRRFMQTDSKAYGKVSDKWQDILPQIAYDVDVEVSIRRIGQETMRKT